ncbi:uncharacterized protein SOCE26_031150 [Sorangium cellulosum]|uniref:Uncharacterized protein n=1 Tax=Sorangium cellulosum TaxID=56 RepID=A0A2L0EQW2_SORCE|nr:uncharacterized protein SOCE26_031150 [Sorangium cellulosum]
MGAPAPAATSCVRHNKGRRELLPLVFPDLQRSTFEE